MGVMLGLPHRLAVGCAPQTFMCHSRQLGILLKAGSDLAGLGRAPDCVSDQLLRMLTMQPVEASGRLFSRRVSRSWCRHCHCMETPLNTAQPDHSFSLLPMGVGGTGGGAAGRGHRARPPRQLVAHSPPSPLPSPTLILQPS